MLFERSEVEQIKTESYLPFSKWFPFALGAAYGLLLRMLFSGHILHGFKSSDVMSASFAVFMPIAIGAITIYFAEKKEQRSFLFYMAAPCVSVSLFVGGTAILLIEGSICIAMALPLFLIQGSIGGLFMGIICRLTKYKKHTVNSLAILPFIIAIGESGKPLPNAIQESRESIHINQKPDVIWHHINFPLNIYPEELVNGFAYKIGVPYPIEARTINPIVGGKRQLMWQRGVTFEEEIEAYDENKFIQWKYIFNDKSFPAGSMDDHVAIGGKYFDLVNTSYRLTEESGGTRLEISVKYRVSTNFNWYAEPWANFLVTDTAKTILNFYKQRSEPTVLANPLFKRTVNKAGGFASSRVC